jgi:small-conductance mechanosensitive channel
MDIDYSIFLDYLEESYLKEFISTIIGTISLFFYLKLKNYSKKSEKKEKIFFYLWESGKFIYLFLFLLIFYYFELNADIYLSAAVFKNLYLFFIFYEFVDISFEVFKLKGLKVKRFITVLLIINIFILTFLDVMHNFSLPYGKNYNLIIFLKLIIAIPFLILTFTLSMKASIKIQIENIFFRKTINRIFYFTNLILSLLIILWVTDVFEITFKIILALITFSIITILFLISVFFVNEYINKKLSIVVENFPEVKKRIDTILFIIYIIAIYIHLSVFFQGHLVIEKLKSIYIVQTDVLSISVYSLSVAILFYVFIINLILLVKILIRYLQYKNKGEFEPSPIEAIIYNFGVLLASIIALSMLGITWKVLLPLIGALGIGAGFGLQSIINNYISGFILIFNRKVEIGDIVEIQGKAGEFVGNNQNIIFGVVTDIGVINTVIETVDGISVAVPNSKFVSDNIINYTLTDNLVRMRIPFKVGYDVKKEKVEEILLKVIQEFERFLVRYPKPQVWFNQIKDYYNEYVLVFWIDARNWKKIMWLKSEVYKRVWEEFEKEDIKVPVINVEITASEKQKSIDIKQ